ncbi:hypothetical protein X942_6303 [Burkholderia pseudomallei MSHR5596]|nr:hypothetical protein X942_6303 [Burkholderia pseudomallei MSHR5596]RPA01719.1 hypothetical protein EGT86_35335 [Burkholderia pseudomallei]
MKRYLLRILLAIVLTVPVCLALSRIDSLARWVGSEPVWRALRPVFDLFGSYGVEGDANVIVTLLLVVSFLIAGLFVWGGGRLIAYVRHRKM